MPFVTKAFTLNSPKKAFLFVMQTLQCSQKEAQKHLDKQRLKQNDLPVHKSQIIEGKVHLTYFEPHNFNLAPIFIAPDFVIYEKPSKLLIHPKGYFKHPSLCDVIKSQFGKQANPVHRLDYETSGLIMASRKKQHEAELKNLFETKHICKQYIALVQGHIQTPQTIDLPIKVPRKTDKYEDLKIQCVISPEGKPSVTKIFPIFYDKIKDTTLLKVIPITGRTHQIRIHLAQIGHKIIGESLYGVSKQSARDYLNQKFLDSQTPTLMLHAQVLSFDYKNTFYYIKSHKNFGGNKILQKYNNP
ncbi:RluA family pseudouridine synthase [Helicobacter sp. 11S03491-1]|uniref:RluA family pseudouridine synthase n=1 Tax=Helicobacter sp. 11S03491-1 TaxID=1476196 RepID=UPI000BA70B0A|nr:RluA family pseudouridine synthase [Helicobacter sp. 11S03491-1]PAF41318.1 hypothetical protein BKH45_07370 [Helicobacter sp. 11S03491-1]